MKILALDTSLSLLSVALVDAGQTLGALAVEGTGSRNEKLLPAIDWLLKATVTARHDLDWVVATRGPGSFTGVRVGLATAQGLALALGCRFCGIPTYEALAFSEPSGRVLVYGAAGRGELYISGFEDGAEVVSPALVTRQQLDEISSEFASRLEVEVSIQSRNVALLAAQLARDRIERGEIEVYREVTPIYVRLAEAEVQHQQKTGG